MAVNSQAELGTGLTGDRVRLEAGIRGLRTRPGTQIDLGLLRASQELSSPRRIAGNTPVIVLLTDGVQQRPALASSAADHARELGHRVYAIGLGHDVDGRLLEEIAGSATRLFLAPSPADLARIYEQVAGEVPCPPEAYWGRRAP